MYAQVIHPVHNTAAKADSSADCGMVPLKTPDVNEVMKLAMSVLVLMRNADRSLLIVPMLVVNPAAVYNPTTKAMLRIASVVAFAAANLIGVVCLAY